MNDVEWRPVAGYEGSYEVSNAGQVRSLPRQIPHYCGGTRLLRGRTLRPVIRDGYPQVTLYRDGTQKIRPVHQLVALAFLGQRLPGYEVLHWDGDRRNPHVTNLRYGTHTDNVRDAVRHGTQVGMSRTHCPRRHLLVEPNLVVSNLKLGWRMCRACHQASNYPHLDKQSESDRRYALIMVGAEPGADRRATGQIPAQRASPHDMAVGAALARDNPAPGIAPNGGAPS